MNRVDVSAIEIDEPLWVDRLISFTGKVLDLLKIDRWDLSVVLCKDETIKELNRTWRNKDEATDVLSFESGEEFEDPEEGLRILPGDVVVSLDSLKKNAEYFKVPIDEELRRLLVHGILHLNGLDHASNEANEPMLLRQEALLITLSGEKIIQ